MISKAGHLHSPLAVILQEPTLTNDGDFGPVVKASLFRAQNLFVVPNKSGKLGKKELRRWFADVCVPNVGDKSMILWDALTTHTTKNLADIELLDKEIEFYTIPAGTTGLIQPLGNHILKAALKKVQQLEPIL